MIVDILTTMPGVSITSTGTSAGALIQFDSNMQAPDWIRVAVTAPGYFRCAETEGAATTTNTLITPESPLVLNARHRRFLSFISVTGTAIANVQALSKSSFDMFGASLDLNFLTQQFEMSNQGVA